MFILTTIKCLTTSLFIPICNFRLKYCQIQYLHRICTSLQQLYQSKNGDEEFRTYKIEGLHKKDETKLERRSAKLLAEPRYAKMPTDQDWTNVWPTAASFKWSVVPLPVRQGAALRKDENEGISPAKYANAELMKIPNFLHLTPAHIKKQCAALKDLCSKWPDALCTDEGCRRHFPVEVVLSDYVFASPSIRDPRARHVSTSLKLSCLELDDHARDKFVKLVGDRYDSTNDLLTLTTDRCPTKRQNYEYLQYLLTALYFESWRVEDWESGETEDDVLKFRWELTGSKGTVLQTLRGIQANKDDDKESDSSDLSDENSSSSSSSSSDDENEDAEPVLHHGAELERYKEAVTRMADEGENAETLRRYKESVKCLLNIRSSYPS